MLDLHKGNEIAIYGSSEYRVSCLFIRAFYCGENPGDIFILFKSKT